MSDFKPVIINDIPLKDFFSHSESIRKFYEEYHENIKTIFEIEIDVKQFYNELYSLIGTIGANIDLKFELIDYLQKYFDNIKEDNASNIYYKATLLNSLCLFAYNQVIFENKVFIIYRYDYELDDVDEYVNKYSYNVIIDFLNNLFHKVDRESISKYFFNYIKSYEIVSKITSVSTYDYYLNKNDLKIFKNDFLKSELIDFVIEKFSFTTDKYNELVKMAQVINSYILKEIIETDLSFSNNVINNITSKDVNNNEDCTFDTLNKKPKFDAYEIALLAKIFKEKFKHNRSLEQYEICDGLADAMGFSKATVNQNIKDISTGIRFAKQEKKESLKDKLLLIVNLLDDN